MKANFTLLKFSLLAVLLTALISCKKDKTITPVTNPITAVSGTWSVTQWGGVDNNPLTFTIDANTAKGIITRVGSQPFGFAIGDQLLTGITLKGDGSYSATGKYTYGVGNANTSTRAAVLTLQNNKTQLTIDYPALNAGFPEITYVYQAGVVQ